ncbi:hypothetical protein IGI37_001247 [Enterococcus sp. AZ194]|uniref:acyltransferase family protein n=1 Tax=Enterococcus sp. AZ194 TaxID=2774629 RepID=UPI003F223DBB
MTYILFFFMALFISGIRFAAKDEFHSDYMSKKQTTTINGIFVFLVLLSHATQYLNLSTPNSALYLQLRAFLGQGVVVTFLFYSGFGIMTSIQKKGTQYVKGIPIKIFKLLLQFDVVVILFILVNLFTEYSMLLKTTLLAFTSWTSLRNSNWYITSMLILLLFTFFAFSIARKYTVIGVILTTLFTIAIVYFFMKINRPGYTYNTMICFPFGMFFAYIKPMFDKLVKNDLVYIIVCLITFTIAAYSKVHISNGIEMYSLFMMFLAFSFVVFTKKIKIESPLLDWLGSHVFSIYILQRIPMILLSYYGVNRHYFIFTMLSFFMTLILALLFDQYVMKLVNYLGDSLQRLFSKKEVNN